MSTTTTTTHLQPPRPLRKRASSEVIQHPLPKSPRLSPEPNHEHPIQKIDQVEPSPAEDDDDLDDIENLLNQLKISRKEKDDAQMKRGNRVERDKRQRTRHKEKVEQPGLPPSKHCALPTPRPPRRASSGSSRCT